MKKNIILLLLLLTIREKNAGICSLFVRKIIFMVTAQTFLEISLKIL